MTEEARQSRYQDLEALHQLIHVAHSLANRSPELREVAGALFVALSNLARAMDSMSKPEDA